GAAETVAGLGHDGRVFGVAAAGDDDAVDDGGAVSAGQVVGEGEGGRQAGADQQGARRRSGLEKHETEVLKTEVQSQASLLDAGEAAEVLVFRREAARATAGAAERARGAAGWR